MTVRCPACHAAAGDDSRFCGQCGSALGLAAARATPATERRPVTVLFVDVVDSTIMAVSLDDEEFHTLLLSVTAAVAGAVRAVGGYVSEILGDGVVAFFGIPNAHEDDAVRAVRAALAAVDVGRQLEDTSRGPGVRLRAGIHSGNAVVGAKEVAPGNVSVGALGVIPTMAARLQAAAGPGEVLCSESTWRLVEGFVDGEAVGPLDLKGFPSAVTAWRATGLTAALDRVDARLDRSAFVGRDDELAVLTARADRARAGSTQVVWITGEAGIGKSRLVRAFLDGVAADGFTRIVVRGQPDRLNTPLAPVIESLELALRPSTNHPATPSRGCGHGAASRTDHARLIGALLDPSRRTGSSTTWRPRRSGSARSTPGANSCGDWHGDGRICCRSRTPTGSTRRRRRC